MPLYENRTEQNITPEEYGTVKPGGDTVTRRYLKTPNGLTLTQDMAPPIECIKLTSFSSPVTDLAQYSQIIVQNLTNGLVTFTMNNHDVVQGIPVAANGGIFPITNNQDVNSLLFSGSYSSGNVYLICVRSS